MLWFRFARLAVGVTAFALLLSATPTSAGNVRARYPDRRLFKRAGRVFRREPLDPNLVAALGSYEKDGYFTT